MIPYSYVHGGMSHRLTTIASVFNIKKGVGKYQPPKSSLTNVPSVSLYSPKSCKNRLVHPQTGTLGTELQVGEALDWLHGVSRSTDQKCTPAS